MGQSAIVTGASSGIGRAVSVGLLRSGYDLALAGRNEEHLDETVAFAGDVEGTALVVPTDVRNAASVAELFEAAADAFGRIDLLFNNAGVSPPIQAPDEVDVETWRDTVDTNLTGAFLCLREAFRHMKAQDPPGGRIINNGSISAHVPRPGQIAYTATKHAITGLTRAASLDGRNFGICVGQIDIGNVETEMTQVMRTGVPQPGGQIAAEPLMQMEQVVDTVLHMAALPLDANIPFVTIMANGMPFMGRG